MRPSSANVPFKGYSVVGSVLQCVDAAVEGNVFVLRDSEYCGGNTHEHYQVKKSVSRRPFAERAPGCAIVVASFCAINGADKPT